jgi:hypothetical protein
MPETPAAASTCWSALPLVPFCWRCLLAVLGDAFDVFNAAPSSTTDGGSGGGLATASSFFFEPVTLSKGGVEIGDVASES